MNDQQYFESRKILRDALRDALGSCGCGMFSVEKFLSRINYVPKSAHVGAIQFGGFELTTTDGGGKTRRYTYNRYGESASLKKTAELDAALKAAVEAREAIPVAQAVEDCDGWSVIVRDPESKRDLFLIECDGELMASRKAAAIIAAFNM